MLARVDPGVSSIEADGALAEGTSFTLITLPDDEATALAIVEAEPAIGVTGRFEGEGFVVDTLHRVETTTQGGSRIVYRTRTVGPAADDVGPEIGPAITSDFPEVVAGLIEHAFRGRPTVVVIGLMLGFLAAVASWPLAPAVPARTR